MTHFRQALILLSLLVARCDAGEISFNRDVRPILAEHCFQCHGPDKARRKADLRLDDEKSAIGDDGVIVRGDAGNSEIVRRLQSSDPDEQMPPPSTKRTLNPQQIETIRAWIDQGAKWERHWAFIPPVRPGLPDVEEADWPSEAIDRLILRQLEDAGQPHSPRAAAPSLIRRLALDVTGLPPTVADANRYASDNRPDAIACAADRLIHSPHFGERMAVPWLDAARYADTSGYQNDGPRDMWRWRDWVIEAFNANKPFDEFTVEQLAGDMLPGATLEQKIASAFNRNHRGNAEGGIIPEEYAVEYVVDRVDTTSTVFLGLTVGCARCHDHKFDPIGQQEFYQLFAYFNNVPESGRAVKIGNSPPFIKAPTRLQQKRLASLQAELASARESWRTHQKRMRQRMADWLAAKPEIPAIAQLVRDDLVARFPLDADLIGELAAGTADEQKQPDSAENNSKHADGVFGGALVADGEQLFDVGDVANFGFFDRFAVAVWVKSETLDGGILSRMSDDAYSDGYDVHLEDGHIHVDLVKRWLDDSIRVHTRQRIAANEWRHVAVTYDGSRVAAGIRVFIDGRQADLHIDLDGLNQEFANDHPLRIGSVGTRNQFRGLIDDVRLYSRPLDPDEVAVLAASTTVQEIATRNSAEWSDNERKKLEHYFLHHHAQESAMSAFRQLQAARESVRLYTESLPTVMVMQERSEVRSTFVLNRGQYDQPTDPVTRGLPRVLNTTSARPENRLELARWLTSPNNPLAARVFVNRVWQSLFGVGLVRTVEDFGTQGAPPTNPELLDWLAVEFMHTGWDVKALVRRIVSSETWQQSSAVSEGGGDNSLLSRAPRFRLSAETIRDQALAIAGLLTAEVGGPSVKPYQPDGLWKEIATDGDYEQVHGANLYRRSLYTYWKRTVAPPTMTAFDATARESCTVRRSTTNTPLQALTLLNETAFVEASRVLAQRAVASGCPTPTEQIVHMFRRATLRMPAEREQAVLIEGYKRHREHYSKHTDEAADLISTGEYPVDEALNPVDLATLTTIASVILNLDEVVTRE